MAKQKITDEQFVEAYMAAQGSYEGTADYIQKKFNVPFSRQAVHKRIKAFPSLKKDVREILENDFDDHLLTFAGNEENDLRLRVRIYLQMKNLLFRLNNGKQNTNQEQRPLECWDVNGNILTFTDDEEDRAALERVFRNEPGPGMEAWEEARRKKQQNG